MGLRERLKKNDGNLEELNDQAKEGGMGEIAVFGFKVFGIKVSLQELLKGDIEPNTPIIANLRNAPAKISNSKPLLFEFQALLSPSWLP